MECLEGLKMLPDNSIDAIITDPPYGLSFMGKKWDYDVPSVDIWKECLRVLKPGGHLLAFAGTRTQHRMAVRIEDAGFEIRDMIAWVYGSGFPKSLNIGKAVDKLQGNEREVVREEKEPLRQGGNVNWDMRSSSSRALSKGISEWEGRGTALKPAIEPITLARKPIEGTVAENCLKWGTGGINIDESRVEHNEELKVGFMKTNREKGLNSTSYGGEKDNRTEDWTSTQGRFPANLIHDNSEEVRACFPETKSGKATVGTGGINIDESRVGTGTGEKKEYVPNNKNNVYGKNMGGGEWDNSKGRFPANLIHDNSEEVRECFPETKSGKAIVGTGKGFAENASGIASTGIITSCFADSGNASRFFKSIIYQAKASKSERNKGCEGLEEKQYSHDGRDKEIENPYQRNKSVATNNHPTVKPIALMEYLIKMVTSKGGIVLDPFAGSGTTLMACKKLGRKYVGYEMDAEYCKIAEARMQTV